MSNSAKDTKTIGGLFAYFFGRIDLNCFIQYVGDSAEGVRLKDIARANGYILKNCKLYAYACHCARLKGEPNPKYGDYAVAKADAAILKRLNLNHLKAYKAFTLKEYDKLLNQVLNSSELKNYIGKFVTKKMTFLMRSYGETRHDLESFLGEQGLLAIYKMYPRYESYLHVINIAKANIHNKGQSLITSKTAKSRQRLRTNQHGEAEQVHVAMEDIGDIEAPPSYGLELRDKLMALSQLEMRMTPRAKTFLWCAAGQYHPGFSEFLQCSNEDAAESMQYPEYLSSLADYFEVNISQVNQLFLNIRKSAYKCNLPLTPE